MQAAQHTQTPDVATTGRRIHSALTGHRLIEPPRPPAAPEKLLLTAAESAALLGMSTRQFVRMRATLPAPVALGPRHVRWKRADLAQWVANLASAGSRQEPPQLKAGKAARKGTPGASAAEPGSPAAKTEQARGAQPNPVPSNPEATAQAGAAEG